MDETTRKDIVTLLNATLQLEHAAAIQYGSHAEQITGLYAEPIISRLQDSAADEVRHQSVLRGLIGDYLYDVPAIKQALAQPGGSVQEIIQTNIASENEAIAFYKAILVKVHASQAAIPEIYETLEHAIRHILMEEQEHLSELYRLTR